jgi:hypothetical protein
VPQVPAAVFAAGHAGQSHLSLFTFNGFGELAATGTTITVGVPDANGVAILSPRDDDRN